MTYDVRVWVRGFGVWTYEVDSVHACELIDGAPGAVDVFEAGTRTPASVLAMSLEAEQADE